MSIPVKSPIDMGSQKIVNLLDPTNPQDAASKAYVDGHTGGGSGWPNPSMGAFTFIYASLTANSSNFTVGIGRDTSATFGTTGGNGSPGGTIIGVTLTGSTASGFEGSLLHAYNVSPYMNVQVGVNGTTAGRLWVGLTSNGGSTQMASNNPAGNYAAFLWEVGNNFKCITKDGTTQTIVDSGVALVSGTLYRLTINCDSANSQVLFYINGSLVATITTHLPTAATAMKWMQGLTQTTGSGDQLFAGRVFVVDQLS